MNFVDRIFVGELTNTIMCEECEHVSKWNKAKDLNSREEPIRHCSVGFFFPSVELERMKHTRVDKLAFLKPTSSDTSRFLIAV